ncbi:sensor histidine kinase [Paenibacillus sp. 598K]|uniref:sensor histidine kinase n=1 Tax=Paenibacillus sp. 598K TaxID=1117987 RepID=UPI001623805A|nr:histidine kinase [Paenibacillus sp. 598K]
MNWRRWWPESLKYRMFTAYILLVVVPFSALCVIGFSQIEQVLKQNQIGQNSREVESFRSDLLDLTGLMTRSLILISQNPSFEQYLGPEGQEAPHEARREINRNLDSLANSFFLSTPSVYMTVVDRYGSAYFNYTPRQAVDGAALYEEIAARLAADGGQGSYYWQEAATYVVKDIVSAGTMLTIDALLLDDRREPFGALRISIDHERWLGQWARAADPQAEYLVIRGGEHTIFRSRTTAELPQELSTRLGAQLQAHPDRPVYETVDGEAAMVLASYMPSLDWMLVKKISLEELFAETDAIKRNVLLAVLALTLVFIAATLLLSSAVTKPLHKLRVQMSKAADNELRVTLPTEPYSGEILHLLTSFNRMIADIQQLIYRLKVEERQKESVRFQILVSQMDPHFLLNTLNLIKSQALKHQDRVTFDICVSLGMLLETSLNTEVDLVPLTQEISFTEAYMHIQNTRFNQRYRLELSYDPSLAYALVPKFTLQPLVENAIIHGFADMPDGGEIAIRIERSSDRELRLLVSDDGRGLEAARQAAARSTTKRKRKGIGLDNIRERLELLYKGEAALELYPATDRGGTTVEIRLPLLVSAPYQREGQEDV